MNNENNNQTSKVVLPKLMTVCEVAEKLKLGRSTVYLLIRRNELTHVRFGRAVRVRPDDLEKFIEANTAY